MVPFQSNEEFFQAVRDLVARLEVKGQHEAAAELRRGLGCLNGLTDGWALLLESIESVGGRASGRLDPAEKRELERIRDAAHRAVYRR